MRKILLLVSLMLVLAGSASAGEIYVYSAAAEYPSSGGATQSVNSSATHPYVTARFAPSATSAVYFHLTYPADASTTTTTFKPYIQYSMPVSTSGAVCWRASVAGIKDGDAYQTIASFGTAQTVTSTVPGTAFNLKIATTATNIGVSSPASGHLNAPLVLKVERADGVGGCTNDATGSADLHYVRLNY